MSQDKDTSSIKGSVTKSVNGGAPTEISVVSGTIEHSSDRTLTLSDPVSTLTGSEKNGFIETWSDETTEVAAIGGTGIGTAPVGELAYTRILFIESNENGSNPVSSIGVIGIPTLDIDVPTEGTAEYTGIAAGVFGNTSGTINAIGSDNATLTADFGNGRVDVNIASIFVEGEDDPQASVPFDQIEITNMAISGNEFSGTTVTTLSNGSAVSAVGSNSEGQSEGVFYGYSDARNGPAEVGGTFLSSGDENTLTGVFIVD